MFGIIGQKLGMTQIFLDNGNAIPVSLIKIDNNVIVNKKEADRDGYNAIVLGTGDVSDKKIKNIYKNQFKNSSPKKYLKEFRVEKTDGFEIGQELNIDVFNDIKYVDVTGISKGKGTQGVIKRHGFHGGRATHGSKFHRENGSTGQNTYPAHCFKGVKRSGRMGFEQVTIQKLQVVKIDKENNVLFICGAVPGINNSLVYIRKSCKSL
jgi:large subunit ribosomal protein L3